MLTRVSLIIVVSVLAAAGYLWLHMRYVVAGVPEMYDVPFILFTASVPLFVLALLIGATALWRRTRHVAALLQFIPCCITFTVVALEATAKFLDHVEDSPVSEFIRQP